MSSTKAPRYDETPVGLIVFMCYLGECILDLDMISTYLPVMPLNMEPVFKDGKMKLPVDNSMFPGTVISFVFHRPSINSKTRRGTLTGDEKCFKPEKTIECRMYSYDGRGLTVKISNTNIHVTASKDEGEDVEAVECLIDSIIHCNNLIKTVTYDNPTLVWFKKASKLKTPVRVIEYGREIIRDVAVDYVDIPEDLDKDLIDYFIRLSVEFDNHDCFIEKLNTLCEDISLYYVEEPYISKFRMINKSKWMAHGWIPDQDKLSKLFDNVKEFTKTRACGMSKPLSLKYYHEKEDGDIETVNICIKSMKFSISGKSDESMRIASDIYLCIIEKFRKILESRVKR